MHKEGRSRWNEGLLSAQRRMGGVSVRCILLSAVVVLLTALPASAGPNLSYLYREIATNPEMGYSASHVPSINASGQMVFVGYTDGDEHHSIYKGHVGTLQKIIDETGPYGQPQGPTINDLGNVAFRGRRYAPSESYVVRYTAATQGFTNIAAGGTGKQFGDVRGASINNAGVVVFQAERT